MILTVIQFGSKINGLRNIILDEFYKTLLFFLFIRMAFQVFVFCLFICLYKTMMTEWFFFFKQGIFFLKPVEYLTNYVSKHLKNAFINNLLQTIPILCFFYFIPIIWNKRS